MVSQDPMGYLDPLMPVGRQIAESLRESTGLWARDGVEGAGAAEVEARVTDLTKMDLPTGGNRPALPHEPGGSASGADRARWPWGRPC